MEKTATLNLRVNPVVKERAEELHEKLQRSYDNIETGNVQDAATAFAKFRES